MIFTLDAIVHVLVIVAVVLVCFWLIGALAIGIPAMILSVIKLIIVISALAAVLKVLGIV